MSLESYSATCAHHARMLRHGCSAALGLALVAMAVSSCSAQSGRVRHTAYGGGKAHAYESTCDCGAKAPHRDCGGCGGCALCLPRIVPAVLHGVGQLLDNIFCCGFCGSPACDSCGGGKASAPRYRHANCFCSPLALFSHRFHAGACGCDIAPQCGCGVPGSKLTPVSPSDPFIDDEDFTPPPIPSAARLQRISPAQSRVRSASYVSDSPVSRQPALLNTAAARRIDDSVESAETRRRSSTDSISVMAHTPANPLRN